MNDDVGRDVDGDENVDNGDFDEGADNCDGENWEDGDEKNVSGDWEGVNDVLFLFNNVDDAGEAALVELYSVREFLLATWCWGVPNFLTI